MLIQFEERRKKTTNQYGTASKLKLVQCGAGQVDLSNVCLRECMRIYFDCRL